MSEATPAGAMTVPIDLHLSYAHGLGALSPYFAGLCRGVAMATRCHDCRQTWFAPRLVCRCGSTSMDWVQLTGRGTIVAATHGRATLPGTDVTAEFGFALIRLDGADNLCFGRLGRAASRLGAGSAVRLSRAEGEWAHPAQCAEYVPE